MARLHGARGAVKAAIYFGGLVKQETYRLLVVFAAVILFFDGALLRLGAQSQATKDLSASERRLVEKAKEEVFKELRESDFLKEQIQLGIQEYVRQQQEAQAAAKL